MRSLVIPALLILLVVASPSAAFNDGQNASSRTATAQLDSTSAAEMSHEAAPSGDTESPAQLGEGHEAPGTSTEEAQAEENGSVLEHLAHHLLDSDRYDLFGYSIQLPKVKGDFSFLGPEYTAGFQITKHMIGLLIASLLVIVLVIPAMGRTRHGEVPKGFGNFLEVLVVFVRDEVVYSNMGKEHGRKWLPFFLTLFFLILFSNLLGLIPWGTTPTGNVNVTAGLAIASLFGVFFAGVRQHGIKYIATFIPHGVPWYVIWLLFPIEVFGLLVKHFALTIRLFANMLAGHTVIGVFLALILTPFVAFASVPGAVAISMLELFVAFLQSYIFIMLGSLFVGMAIHPH